MKSKLFSFLVLSMLAAGVQAKIWRVNNTTSLSADFSDLQAAIDSASAGDTIYVEGSATSYTDDDGYFDITKQLTITGPGFYLTLTDSTLYNKMSAMIESHLNIYPAAKHTLVQGLHMRERHIYVGADSVTIQRCLGESCAIALGHYFLFVAKSSTYTETTLPIVNPVVKQNKVRTIGFDHTIINGIVSNNIIYDHLNGSANSTMLISFNTIQSMYGVNNSVIQNNIIYLVNSGSDCVWSNNKIGDEITAHVIGGDNNETYYKLDSESSAVGAATDGTDLGAFGGTDPYVLSGLPAIPHVWNVESPVTATASKGLAVKIQVKTQK